MHIFYDGAVRIPHITAKDRTHHHCFFLHPLLALLDSIYYMNLYLIIIIKLLQVKALSALFDYKMQTFNLNLSKKNLLIHVTLSPEVLPLEMGVQDIQ